MSNGKFDINSHKHCIHQPQTSQLSIVRRPIRQPGEVHKTGLSKSTSQGAVGDFILHNWEGKFIQAATFYLGAVSGLIVEVMTMRNRIKAAVQAGFTDIRIEGDNKIFIQAVQSHIQASWEIHILIEDIRTYIQLCNNVHITHVFMQKNCAAKYLAKHGLSLHSTVVSVWNEVPHKDFHRILYEDNLG